MQSILPISLDNLISLESARLELKATWSDQTCDQVIRTICAFANDFLDVNGGYIVIGIGEKDGVPELPPKGVDESSADGIQRKIFEKCKLIVPDYIPGFTAERYQGKTLVVIWCPPGQLRPYQAPKQASKQGSGLAYYVRQGNVSLEATGITLTQLMQKANQVPFDDRLSHNYSVDVISSALVRNFLSYTGSDLVTPGTTIADQQLYRIMGLSRPINGHDAPVNVALLLFVDDPEQFFRGARIEIVEFSDDGDTIKTQILRGPLHKQIEQALSYLGGMNSTTIRKIPGQAETQNTVAFPYEAMREAIVNAVYHRSYEGQPDPIIIQLHPDRMEIISYPGPLPGIKPDDFRPNNLFVPRHRNRRIGELLKQLRLAEMYGTGIRKIYRRMQENGSPEPTFDFDEARSYFRVRLPAHPQYVITHALRKSAELWSIGEHAKAIRNLENTLATAPNAGSLIAQLIEYQATNAPSESGLTSAERLFNTVARKSDIADRHRVYIAMAEAYLNHGNSSRASEILKNTPYPPQPDATLIELAILAKRVGNYEKAHSVFKDNYDLLKDDSKAVHEYAQTKTHLAGRSKDHYVRQQLNREAESLLRRAIQLADNDVRKAWCFYDLARVLCWLRSPRNEVLDACAKARELIPAESRFEQWYNRYQRENTC